MVLLSRISSQLDFEGDVILRVSEIKLQKSDFYEPARTTAIDWLTACCGPHDWIAPVAYLGLWISFRSSLNVIFEREPVSFSVSNILANVNVNSHSRSLYAVARPSVVCNVRAPYSGGSNFRQYFYGIRYLGHPLTSTENFMEIVPGEPLRRGELNTRGVAKYSDFWPIDSYISETVHDRR